MDQIYSKEETTWKVRILADDDNGEFSMDEVEGASVRDIQTHDFSIEEESISCFHAKKTIDRDVEYKQQKFEEWHLSKTSATSLQKST